MPIQVATGLMAEPVVKDAASNATFIERPTVSFRDSESLRFIYGVCSSDHNQRTQCLDQVIRIFDGWLEGYGSPKEMVLENHFSNNDLSTDLSHLIREQLPDLLRLSITCPFLDVRERTAFILQDLQDRGIKIPRSRIHSSSRFIPGSEIIPVDTDDDNTSQLFVDAFLHNNRLEHMLQVMAYHPKYMECFLKVQQYLLRGDGPLPYHYRHYIAIMAAGRHQCSYLIHIQQIEFLLAGGDPRWLQGLQHIPKKLQHLYELNKIMAHRPWLINKSHIEKLTKGEANWSLSELTHALVILSHFHSLASFVYGCGIDVEIDQPSGHTSRPPSHTDQSNSCSNHSSPHNSLSSTPASHDLVENEGAISELMERMRRLNEEPEQNVNEEELLKRFEYVESSNAELPAASRLTSPSSDILMYVEDPDFTYQDFAKRGHTTEIPTFRAQDCSWSEHGFSLANRYYTDIGTLLDEKFGTTYNLTYRTMGDNFEVDTSSFRLAIWNYIQCMFGIRHDDYDYREVNELLGHNLKSYVKTVTCYPERVTRKEYDSFMYEFKHSEKVHVNLMVFEARLQAELLYSLRAVMRHMT